MAQIDHPQQSFQHERGMPLATQPSVLPTPRLPSEPLEPAADASQRLHCIVCLSILTPVLARLGSLTCHDHRPMRLSA
jgi:hypothetical protein